MAATPTRLWFLDWLRIAAFGLLVPYHVGMYYVSWDWHVKSLHAGTLIEPLMRLSSPWRLDLLFLVSGAATAFMLRRHAALGPFLRQRAARLLLPLLFGVLVIVPPQSYLEVVQKHGYAGSWLDFMRLYLGGYGGFCTAPGRCLILPTWNHLWFLPYLFAYTALLCGVLRRLPAALDRVGGWLDRNFDGGWFIALPIVWLALTRATLQPVFPVTHAFVDDPFAHLQHGSMFLLGAAFARAPAVWARADALRWPALVLAAAAWALLVGVPAPGSPWRAIAYSVQQWCAIVAALGFARHHLDVDHPIRHTLALAVFPVYILHQTLIVLLARALAPLALHPLAEGALLVGGTFVLAFAGYAAVRRIGPLRRWFGLPREGDRQALAPAPEGVRP